MPTKLSQLGHLQAPAEESGSSAFAKVSMRDIAYLFFRHKKKIIFCWIAGFAASVFILLGGKKIYESEAKMLVKFVEEERKPTEESSTYVVAANSWNNIINSEIELLKSRDLAEQVVDDVWPKDALEPVVEEKPEGVLQVTISHLRDFKKDIEKTLASSNEENEPELSPKEWAVIAVTNGLDIEVMPHRNILRVAYRHPNPELARNVLAKLIDLYLGKHMSIHRGTDSYDFFVQQKNTLSGQIREKSEQIKNLKNSFEFNSLEMRQTAYGKKLAEIEAAISATLAEQSAANAKIRLQEQSLKDLSADISNPDLQKNIEAGLALEMHNRIEQRLIDLKLEEQELLTTYTQKSIPVQKIRTQIDYFEKKLSSYSSESVPNRLIRDSSHQAFKQTYLSLMAEKERKAAADATLKTMYKELDLLRERTKKLNEQEILLNMQEQELALLMSNFQKYSHLAEESRINQAKETEKIDNISIVQPATVPLTAVQTDKIRNAGVAVAAGIALGILLAFFSENFIDHTLKKPEDVEKSLSLPTLVSIPRGKRKLKSLKQSPELIVSTPEGSCYWDLPRDIKDHYDLLCEKLISSLPKKTDHPFIIGVTSTSTSETSGNVAANLAVALGERDGKTLLVDATNNGNHKVFGKKGGPSLSEIDVDGLGRTKVLQHNLYYLPASEVHSDKRKKQEPEHSESDSKNEEKEKQPQNLPSTRLPQRRCDDIIEHVKKLDCGFVVVDMPPMNENASALRLARLSNHVLLVVESEKTRRESVKRCKSILDHLNVNILGVVLNKRRFYIPEWIYNRI